MNNLEVCDGVQSWVSRAGRRGLSTHPCGGACVECDSAGCALDLNKPSRDEGIDCLHSDGLELCSTLHAFGDVGGDNVYSWRSVESSQVAACLNIFQSAEI